ncbi:UNVERIFIED_CONTAM: G2/mitotic-specific cyclin [Siphonaria sp. JEL0065]|nr:G2/mitotic-specific cyclin [Siphonaria sp. JEL0065]
MVKLIVLDEVNVSISERASPVTSTTETIISPVANPEITIMLRLQEMTGLQQPQIEEPVDSRPPDEVTFYFEAVFNSYNNSKFVCSEGIAWAQDLVDVSTANCFSFPVTKASRDAFGGQLQLKLYERRFTFTPMMNEAMLSTMSIATGEAGTRPGSSASKAGMRPVSGNKKEPPRPVSPKKEIGKKTDKGKKGLGGKGKKEDDIQYEKKLVGERELAKTNVALKSFLEGQKVINGDFHLEQEVRTSPTCSGKPRPVRSPVRSACFVFESKIQTRRAAAMAAKNEDQENVHAAPMPGKTVKELAVKGLGAGLGLKQANANLAAPAPGKAPPAKAVLAKKQPLAAVHQVQVQPATTKVTKPTRTRSQSAKKSATETAKTAAKATAVQAEVAKMVKSAKSEEVEGEAKPAARKAASKTTVKPAPVPVVAGPKTRAAAVREQSSETGVEAKETTTPAEVLIAEPKGQTVAAPVQDWDDLDADDACDPMMLSEYVVEIFEYMKQLEVNAMPNPQYMDSQKELKWNMRDILIDWLIDIHNKFRLLPETLYLAVNIIDRFLSLRVVSLVKLQLVGITSMFIAAKYEEVIAPSIKNFIYMADNGYTEEEIQKAERYVLSVLEFNLQYPSSMSFLRRCSKAENYNIQTRTLAKYLMEISLVDHRFLDVLPSHVAATGLFLARRMLDQGPWDANLTHYSGYAEDAIEPVSEMMIDYLKKPCKHEAFYKKYASKKFMKASIFVKEWMAKQYDL